MGIEAKPVYWVEMLVIPMDPSPRQFHIVSVSINEALLRTKSRGSAFLEFAACFVLLHFVPEEVTAIHGDIDA